MTIGLFGIYSKAYMFFYGINIESTNTMNLVHLLFD
jgi:hypothetical protein